MSIKNIFVFLHENNKNNMNSNYLNSSIEEGKRIIRKSSNHHLPLPFRNKLLDKIGDEKIIARLSILCALRVYPVWEEFIPDDSDLLNLLQKAENYICTGDDEEGLLAMAGKMQTFVSNKNDEEHFSALHAGYSAVNAAYEVTGKYIGETSLDDLEIDSHDWDSAFYACLAYNGGAFSINNIDNRKTKEFWEWYLDEGIKKAFTGKQLVSVKKERITTVAGEFNRIDIKKLLEDKEIAAKIDEIQSILINGTSEYKWNEIDVTAYIVNCTRMSVVYCLNESGKEKMDLPFDMKHEINNLVYFIKDRVFNLTDGQGTFYSFQLVIDKNGNRNIQFIYDTQDETLKKIFDDEDFAEDFRKYPRRVEYIPDWLLKILKREKVDINNFNGNK
jgi:hypothetical protein